MGTYAGNTLRALVREHANAEEYVVVPASDLMELADLVDREVANPTTPEPTSLNPCPRCGRYAYALQLGTVSFPRWCVCCSGPECDTSTDYYATKEQAREAWNVGRLL